MDEIIDDGVFTICGALWVIAPGVATGPGQFTEPTLWDEDKVHCADGPGGQRAVVAFTDYDLARRHVAEVLGDGFVPVVFIDMTRFARFLRRAKGFTLVCVDPGPNPRPLYFTARHVAEAIARKFGEG